MLEHCERALYLVISRGADSRGILKIGSGDWNDGFDKMSGGSSVWLTWFAANCFKRFAKLTCGREHSAYAERLGKAANASFNGKYFERAYYPDGSPLPILDSVAQSWAVLSGFGDKENSKIALRSALDALYDRERKLVKLFAPPFDSGCKSPGYISAYLPGTRENSGQYTHAAIWLAMACVSIPEFERDGRQILRDLLPANHDNAVYRGEPFVLASDVYTNPKMFGRSGWTWYTGASGWYLRAMKL
jgi:cellobiose phosphorylase